MGRPKVRSLLAALLLGARPNTPMRQLSNYARPFSVARFVYRFALAYELLRECRTIVSRISEMHGISADEEGYELKWIRDVPENLRDALCLVHNSGIQSLYSRRPWATAFDVALYHEGLQQGVLSQLHIQNTAGLLPTVKG
jgi:hypothetical protein